MPASRDHLSLQHVPWPPPCATQTSRVLCCSAVCRVARGPRPATAGTGSSLPWWPGRAHSPPGSRPAPQVTRAEAPGMGTVVATWGPAAELQAPSHPPGRTNPEPQGLPFGSVGGRSGLVPLTRQAPPPSLLLRRWDAEKKLVPAHQCHSLAHLLSHSHTLTYTITLIHSFTLTLTHSHLHTYTLTDTLTFTLIH